MSLKNEHKEQMFDQDLSFFPQLIEKKFKIFLYLQWFE